MVCKTTKVDTITYQSTTSLEAQKFKNQLSERDSLIKVLMAEVKNAKANSTKTLTIKEVQRDTLPFPNAEKLNMIKSMNALEQMYKSKLRNCEYDKSQLQSKLNIINGELNKRQGIP